MSIMFCCYILFDNLFNFLYMELEHIIKFFCYGAILSVTMTRPCWHKPLEHDYSTHTQNSTNQNIGFDVLSKFVCTHTTEQSFMTIFFACILFCLFKDGNFYHLPSCCRIYIISFVLVKKVFYSFWYSFG